MKSLSICILVVCLCVTGITGYTVQGNQIYDPNGNKVLLRGVDRPSFEWDLNGEMASANDYLLMASWGANVVRLATNQDFWLGLSDASTSATYQANIDQQIAWANAAGMGLIIDLHWNNASGQQMMADHNSITYWSQVAARYKSNAWVMFELYNEPHDIAWSVWLSGNSEWAGMQQLYDAVRAAGANNLCLVGGLNWAFDLSGVGQGYAVQGTNIAYATHPYDYAGKQLADWPAAFGYLAPTVPVVMTEFGQYCNTDTYVSDLLTYAQTNEIHWTAWAWYVSGCSFPSIISDWNGTPITGVGVLVQSYLSGNPPAAAITSGTTSVSPSGSASSSGSSSSGSSVSGASSALTVYTNSLASGWQDWSWAAAYSLSDTTYVQSGSSASIKFTLENYGGIYLHYTSSFQLGAYSTLQFYVNGGLSAISASYLSVLIYGSAGNNAQIGNAVPFPVSVPASQWSMVSIPLTQFGVATSTQISGFAISTSASSSAGTMWIDNISFLPPATSDNAPTSPATAAPTNAPTAAPTHAATPAPTHAPTAAPTHAPTAAPTHAATPTAAPTHAATPAPTHAPTAAPTHAATPAPTRAPTAAPTHAATPAPTHAATVAPTHAPTAAPTHAAATPVPTHAATSTSGCGTSSVQLTQTAGASWPGSNGQTVTQYTAVVSTTCAGKTLVGLQITATNWNPIYSWNVNASPSSAAGESILTLASYAAATTTNPFTIGYQNVGGQASFTITSATFQ